MYLILIIAFIAAFPVHADTHLAYMREVGETKQIYLANGKGEDAKAVTSGEAWHLYPDLDSSGRTLAYVEGTPEAGLNVVTLDIKSGEKVARTQGPGMRLHPDFSGNGRYLGFSTQADPTSRAQIEILDLQSKSSEPKKIVSDYNCYFPALSSDGSFVVFQRTKGKDLKDIVLMNLADGEQKVLTDEKGEAMAPSLSFDDRYIVFTQRVENNWDVYRMDLRDNSVIRLTDSPARDFAPTLRADGSVLFASDRTGHFLIYEISKDRSETKLIVGGEGEFYAPSVSGEVEFVQGGLAALPDPARSSFGTTRVGNRIYIVGGHQGHEHTYPPESFLDEVAYYDLETGKWEKTSPRPSAAHGYGVASRGRFLYAFGGFAYSAEHDPKWKSLDAIDRLDTETGEWTRLPVKLSRPRSSNVVVPVGDKVYLIAGWDSTPKKQGDLDGEFLRTIEVFDMKKETLELSPYELPNPLRRALTAVLYNSEILLVGGLGVGASHFELLDKVTAFNPFTGQWRELPPLPFATFAPAAGILADTLYVFGGMFKTGKLDYVYVNHIYAHQFGMPEWRNTGRFLAESKGFAMVVPLDCCRRLGVLGGHSYHDDTDSPITTFETFASH